MKKVIASLIIGASFAQAIPIEVFKSKPAARFHNYGVTMNAKIKSIDCTKVIGYGAKARQACFAIANYKRKGKMDDTIYLYFDKSYQNRLNQFIQAQRYGFVACTYTHKTKRLKQCSIK